MPGLHNVYNALGALALAQRLGVAPASALDSLAAYQPVFGRWSLVRRGDTAVQVNLVKNPAGMNQTLRALREVPGEKALVFVLNDNIADGRDISWIWDVDMEELLPERRPRRHERHAQARDGAATELRRRARRDARQRRRRVAAALDLAAERGARNVYLLPTYTALKEVRGALSRLGGGPPVTGAQGTAAAGRRCSTPSTSIRPR